MNTKDIFKPVKFELTSIIDSLEERTFTNLQKVLKLYNNIIIKSYDDHKLAMITNNFNKVSCNVNVLERECRSIIIEKSTLDIICYSYDDIYYNSDAKNYLLENNNNIQIQECFEGTFLSIYYFDGEWHISTRKCLDAKKSKWTNDKSYFILFEECCEDTFENFTRNLKEEYCYFFVLVHHENKNIVDYSEYFNDPTYKKIYHVLTRKAKTFEEVNICDTSIFNTDVRYDNPIIFSDYSILDNENRNDKLILPIKLEGLIVKCYNQNNGKNIILKFQTNSYQMMSLLKPNHNNIYKSFIELYQHGMLKRHLEYFPGNIKISNPLFKEKPYDTIGIIDATFKVITSELFELYKAVWCLKNGSHKNKELYNILSNEYKTILYKIKGIYYKKKENFINSKINKDDKILQSNNGLRIFDIYTLLKNYETKELIKLMHARKKMKSITDSDNDNDNDKIYEQFRLISSKCDRISLKMIAILLNNMFPDDTCQIIDDNVIDI